MEPNRPASRLAALATPRRLWVFFSTVTLGLAAHFLLYSRPLLVLDGLWNGLSHISSDWELSLGRWGLRLVDLARGGIVSAPLITLLCLIYMGLTAVLLCELFAPKSRLTCFLLAAAPAVSPQLASLLIDTYCADAYCLAVLLAVTSMALVFGFQNRGRTGLLRLAGGAVCLVFALGLYQCTLGVAALLALFLLYRQLGQGAALPQVGRKALEALAVGAVGTLLYYAVLLCCLSVTGVQLADYGGANGLSLVGILAVLPASLRYSVHYLSEYLLFDGIVHNTVWHRALLWLALCGVFALSQLLLFIKNKAPLRVGLMLVCLALMPPAISIMYLISPVNQTNLMMSLPVLFFMPCLLCLVCEAADRLSGRLPGLCRLAAVALCGLLLWTQLWQVQATYMVLEYNLNQTRRVAQDVYSRAVQLPDYDAALPWLFVGTTNELADQRGQEKLYARSTGFFTQGVFFDESEASAPGWERFFDAYLGMQIVSCDTAYYPETADAAQALPLYPAAGCVQVLDGMVVVRFK